MGMMLLQEGSTVSWDPSICCYCDRGFWIPDGTGWVLLVSFAIYLCWHPLRWLVALEWRLTRFVLPTLMLIAAIMAPSLPINVAGAAAAGVASLALEDAAVPAWVIAGISALMVWVSWYAAVLCIELRAAPARLELSRL
jgi:hypothetical protein